MSTIVAIWNCTHVDVGWETKTSTERLRIFREAAFRAHAAALGNADATADPKCIFVSPEYTFAEPHTQWQQAAMQVTAPTSQRIIQTIQQVSLAHPDVLFVPGTIAELNTPTTARNRCVAVRRGALLCDFGKRRGIGEVDPASGVTFQPGVGFGTFTIGARTYGVQICSDATTTSLVQLPADVDVQLVTGQGVGQGWVRDQFQTVQVIADFASSSVRKANQGQRTVPSSWQEDTRGGGAITYYKV